MKNVLIKLLDLRKFKIFKKKFILHFFAETNGKELLKDNKLLFPQSVIFLYIIFCPYYTYYSYIPFAGNIFISTGLIFMSFSSNYSQLFDPFSVRATS